MAWPQLICFSEFDSSQNSTPLLLRAAHLRRCHIFANGVQRAGGLSLVVVGCCPRAAAPPSMRHTERLCQLPTRIAHNCVRSCSAAHALAYETARALYIVHMNCRFPFDRYYEQLVNLERAHRADRFALHAHCIQLARRLLTDSEVRTLYGLLAFTTSHEHTNTVYVQYSTVHPIQKVPEL